VRRHRDHYGGAMAISHKLPPSGPAREALREKGQFWTPDWVTEAMVAYVLGHGAETLFDPAVGAGAFFRAGVKVAIEMGRRIRLLGTELDPGTLLQAEQAGLSQKDLADVQLRDFLLDPPPGPFPAIVANPPYIRHHRLSPEVKAKAKAFAERLTGTPIDGRAGLHVYFLLRALELLQHGGRLAFIMPADTCEGVFAPPLWRWISRRYRLDAVVTFDPAATPFPGVDTNPVVFLISREPTQQSLAWARCLVGSSASLKGWALSGLPCVSYPDLEVVSRDLAEALSTGLSRVPQHDGHSGLTLADVATVLRGIATGANQFFFLTARQAAELGIPGEFLRPAIGRTRDVPGDTIADDLIRELEAKGRPTRLLCLDGRPVGAFPKEVQSYIEQGVRMGLPERPLVAGRRPWYKMETRRVPPILFAYLGRRNARFVLNKAGVVPLTGFLCVYPREGTAESLQRLWRALTHPTTLRNLSLVGKSYGSGAIKVEPRALERLPFSPEAVTEAGLQPLLLSLGAPLEGGAVRS